MKYNSFYSSFMIFQKKDGIKIVANDFKNFFSVLGLLGGCAATFSAVNELATTHFTVPCYIQPFLSNINKIPEIKRLNCCGVSQNISISNDSSICSSYFDFYKQNWHLLLAKHISIIIINIRLKMMCFSTFHSYFYYQLTYCLDIFVLVIDHMSVYHWINPILQTLSVRSRWSYYHSNRIKSYNN